MEYDLKAITELAIKAHEGQVDKSGKPYFHHLLGVLHLLPYDATDLEKAAALLHDIVEDTEQTLDDLRKCYPEELIGVIGLLTQPADLNYFPYIRRIAESGNKSAIRVKIADLNHNMHPKPYRQCSRQFDKSIRPSKSNTHQKPLTGNIIYFPAFGHLPTVNRRGESYE